MALDHGPDLTNQIPDVSDPVIAESPAVQNLGEVTTETPAVAEQAGPEATQPITPNLPPPPDNAQTLANPSPKKKKYMKPLAVLGAAAALTAGALAFTHKDGVSSESVKQPTTTAPDYAFNPESDTTVGKIRTALILDTDRVIKATRPSGEVIEVPAIRNTTDPYLLTDSVLANIACIMTDVGGSDNSCLDAFTNSPEVRASLVDFRDQKIMPDVLDGLTPEQAKHTQAAFYDLPGNIGAPPQVSVDDAGLVHLTITSDSGILFNGHTNYSGGHNDFWQGPDTHKQYEGTPNVSHLKMLNLVIDPKGPQGPVVTKLSTISIGK